MKIVSPNTNSYNQVLKRAETVEQAIELLHEMKNDGLKENAWTAVIIIQSWTKNFQCAWEIYKDISCQPNKSLFIALLNKVSTNEQLNLVLEEFKGLMKNPYRYNLENWRDETLERVILKKTMLYT